MEDFNSKYSGEQVEYYLDQIASGNTGGGITTEADPIFSASLAASITTEKITEWNGKQDAILDLDAIRSGASKGATALQSVPDGYATTSELAGKYTKPSDGIPKTDLTSDVQTSLGKADTALQSYTEQYKGTVTGVKINGATKNPSNGVVDLGTVITEHQTLKTINGQSIVGSGDITINSGSSGGSGGAYPEVNHGTADTTLTITPNTFHVWDEVASLTLDFGSETSGVANEFLFQFTSGSTATSLTLPDDIKWPNDSAPTIEANMIYQVSILKGLASVLEFSNPNISVFYIDGIEFEVEEGMTWEEWLESDYNTANYHYEFTDNLIMRNVSEIEWYALPEVVISDIIIINNDYMETPY